MKNKIEELTNFAENLSATTDQNFRIYTQLKVLYNIYGMPENIPIIDGVVNWNGLKIYIIPDDDLDIDDKIYIIPFEIETSLRYPKFDYEDYESNQSRTWLTYYK